MFKGLIKIIKDKDKEISVCMYFSIESLVLIPLENIYTDHMK